MNSLKPKKEMVSVRIPEDMNGKLEQHVSGLGVSKNAFILMLIAQALGSDQQSTLPRTG
ncbi:hypothetical protein [Sporomusa ovata]|uniref:Uncharacterized protein n=1 Tax=Sporomusa ovata TaxID=2378 RepID=A0A0U1L5D9_9FIRM|nr:hypothetical protein [Sporomusa ovata]CQR74124.1 hypothetical protein SpAn4DRAFT_0586 [Sporomusa ovata]